MQIDKLGQLLNQLTDLQGQAKQAAESELTNLRGKIPQSDYEELKKITNFEGINTEEEILTKIERLKEWERKLQK
jgi:hypothetical protein